jgi:hypothetical protein
LAKSSFTLFYLFLSAVVYASAIDEAQSEWNFGEQAHLDKEFDLALVKCKSGLKLLGSPSSYYVRGLRDDTSMKLILAEMSEREEEIERASYITCRVLKDRIELSKQKVNEG